MTCNRLRAPSATDFGPRQQQASGPARHRLGPARQGRRIARHRAPLRRPGPGSGPPEIMGPLAGRRQIMPCLDDLPRPSESIHPKCVGNFDRWNTCTCAQLVHHKTIYTALGNPGIEPGSWLIVELTRGPSRRLGSGRRVGSPAASSSPRTGEPVCAGVPRERLARGVSSFSESARRTPHLRVRTPASRPGSDPGRIRSRPGDPWPHRSAAPSAPNPLPHNGSRFSWCGNMPDPGPCPEHAAGPVPPAPGAD